MAQGIRIQVLPKLTHVCDTIDATWVKSRNARTGHVFIQTPWGLAPACSQQGLDTIRIWKVSA